MKRNPHFCLARTGTEIYLVPFGQEIENLRPSLRMNETSAFLWEKLSECTEEKELVSALAREYEVPQEDLPEIEKDVRVMLRQLMAVGAVRLDFSEKAGNRGSSLMSAVRSEVWDALRRREPWFRDMMIGGLRIRLYGNADRFSDKFNDFYIRESGRDASGNAAGGISKPEKTDSCGSKPVPDNMPGFANGSEAFYDGAAVDIEVVVMEEAPAETENLPVLIKGQTVTVLEGEDFYVIRSVETPVIREAHILKDGSRAVIYMGSVGPDGNADGTDAEEEPAAQPPHGRVPDFKETGTNAEQESTPADAVFHMLRHVFMICAEKRDMYIIHSASILHDGRAWLFSALSGTGKSTHTNLWHKLYGTPYLDGDLNLLAFEDGRPVVKGIPWCGTSGIYTTETWPLGGIILLARDPKNYVEELSVGAKVLGISMRFISPKWNEEMLRGVLDFSERIVKSSGICRLHCNMEDEAAEVCRAWIDKREA